MSDKVIDSSPISGGTKDKRRNIVRRLVDRTSHDRPLPSKRRLYGMIFTNFLVMFIVGWNDATQGPLLPLLQEYYNVNYVIISLIWIAIAIGVVGAAVSNIFLSDLLGFGLLTPLGAAIQAFAYVLMCWGGPYPLFVIAYVFAGLGIGWQDAQVNSITARMPNATTVMFMAHAVYGLGATVSPFVATAFVKSVTDRFYLYFTISMALALITVLVNVLVYQGRTEDQVVGKRGSAAEGSHTNSTVVPDNTDAEKEIRTPNADDSNPNVAGNIPDSQQGNPIGQDQAIRPSSHKFKAILMNPVSYFLAFYIFLYMGVEVTVGGWATTFLITERGGGVDSGYVTSGFFGGLTVGRIILIPVTKWLGHRNSVYLYTLVAIAMEFIIWFVPSLIGAGVCFSLVGVALGPMYPSCVMILTEIMPPDLHTGAIGFLACLGIVGSAIMPFLVGAIANAHGVWVLQPLMVAFLVCSLVLWWLVARNKHHGQP